MKKSIGLLFFALVADFFENGKNFLFGSRFFLLGLFLLGFFLEGHFVDNADEHEDTKGDNEEVNDVLDKIAVAEMDGGIVTKKAGDSKFKVSKVNTTKNKANGRHNEIVDKGTDDFIESTTDDDPDRKIHNVATIDEIAEFFQNRINFLNIFFEGFNISFFHVSYYNLVLFSRG